VARQLDFDWPVIEQDVADALRTRAVLVKSDSERALLRERPSFTLLGASETHNRDIVAVCDRIEPQIALDGAICASIEAKVLSSSELLPATYTMSMVLSFLASTGGRPEDGLAMYMTRTLAIPEDNVVVAALSTSVRLEHAVSLWMRLDMLRASHVTLSGEEPFPAICENESAEVPESVPESKEEEEEGKKEGPPPSLCVPLSDDLDHSEQLRLLFTPTVWKHMSPLLCYTLSNKLSEDRARNNYAAMTLQAVLLGVVEQFEMMTCPSLERLPPELKCAHALALWKKLVVLHS
jgi:hypothetical protein